MHKKYLIIGDFSKRLKFYLAAIQKILAKNQSIIILVPDLSLISLFTQYLKKPYSTLHAGMTKTERWLQWNRIREEKTKIIIGSQSALFAPAQNLGLIIIDQEENETYKNNRSPRFHAVEVASKLADFTSANLILGSLTPRIKTYYEAINGKYQILKQNPLQTKNLIVDMNSEKYVLSNSLERGIEETLQTHQKILLILNRKGEGTKFSCTDCDWIALCKKCGLPLIPQKMENVCFRCEKKYPQPATCPKCHGAHLKPLGLGTARLKRFLTDLFPKAKIIQSEKEIESTAIHAQWDIAITTSYGLKFGWPKIGLVGIIDADYGFNFPDFNSPQKTFQNLFKFLKIGERGLIQTHLPENPLIQSLAHLDYEKFFLEELSQRKKYGYPPFTRLVRLLFKNTSEEKVKKEITRVFKLLTTNPYPLVTISLPHPCFIRKERGKFRYQIIIKTKGELNQENRDILDSLPRGWIVDVDPVDLL